MWVFVLAFIALGLDFALHLLPCMCVRLVVCLSVCCAVHGVIPGDSAYLEHGGASDVGFL